MYLARLQTKGFRCLDNFTIEFSPGLNVIVGPNNAGKTAIVEAISLTLSIYLNPAREIFVNAEDFWHSADGTEKEESDLRIIADLRDVPAASIGEFSDWMVTDGSDAAARITLIAHRDATDPDRVRPKWRVGAMNNAAPSEDSIERIRPVFLPPLRDAERSLRPGRGSRLARLIQHIVDEPTSKEIEQKFRGLQHSIVKVPPFSTAIGRVNERLASATGSLYRQLANLSFVEPEFRRIAELLQMRVGLEGLPDFALTENGLGYNNLLYIATILSQLSEDSNQDLRLLLIEEPEAHLHPQMQQVLVDALMEAASANQPAGESRTQIIMTSHSPLLAAHVPVEDIIVLHHHKVEPEPTLTGSSRPKKGKPLARSIRQFELSQETKTDLYRYLDATKANLFFAEGVILVEGIAETLLLPVLAKAICRPLNEHHVSIVNVGGLAFAPFVELFNSLARLQVPCAVITDSDPYFQRADRFYQSKAQAPAEVYDRVADDEVAGDEILFPEAQISYGRAFQLDQSIRQQKSATRVFRSLKTLEYDLALTEYLESMLVVYKEMDNERGEDIERAVGEVNDQRRRAIRFFKRFRSRDKAQFAQRLASHLEASIEAHLAEERRLKGNDRSSWDAYLAPPPYVADAIKWVTGDCNWDDVS